MSKNGHEVTLKVVPGTSSNRNRQSGKRAESSAHVRLDGNIARRAVKPFEFFWWATELPGFSLRTFPGGAKSWFVQFRQRGKQKRIVLGRPGEMNAREARSAARAELAKAALDGLPEAPKPRRKSAGARIRTSINCSPTRT